MFYNMFTVNQLEPKYLLFIILILYNFATSINLINH